MVHTVDAVPDLPLKLVEMAIATLRPGHRAQMKQGWTQGRVSVVADYVALTRAVEVLEP